MASTKKLPTKKRSKNNYPASKIIASKKKASLTDGQKRFALFGIIGLLVVAGILGSRFIIDAATNSTVDTGVKNYNVWHWNIAGQKINKGSTTNEMTKVATDSILNRKAELVSFNEICESQYRDIKNRLDKASWSTKKNFHTFVTTNPTGCGKDNAYGNAIFIKNGIDDVRRNTLQNDGKKEVRAIVCGLVSNTKDRFCSTHISTSNEEIDGAPINVQQLNRVRSILDTFYNSGERVVIAGDFNAQPHYGRMNSWYASSLSVPNNSSNKGVYREVDDNDSLYCIGYGESTTADGNNEGICGGDKKIDMIFFRDNQVASYNGDSLAVSRTCGAKKNQACSDHRILIGTLTFKAVGQNNTPGGVSPSR